MATVTVKDQRVSIDAEMLRELADGWMLNAANRRVDLDRAVRLGWSKWIRDTHRESVRRAEQIAKTLRSAANAMDKDEP